MPKKIIRELTEKYRRILSTPPAIEIIPLKAFVLKNKLLDIISRHFAYTERALLYEESLKPYRQYLKILHKTKKQLKKIQNVCDLAESIKLIDHKIFVVSKLLKLYPTSYKKTLIHMSFIGLKRKLIRMKIQPQSLDIILNQLYGIFESKEHALPNIINLKKAINRNKKRFSLLVKKQRTAKITSNYIYSPVNVVPRISDAMNSLKNPLTPWRMLLDGLEFKFIESIAKERHASFQPDVNLHKKIRNDLRNLKIEIPTLFF